MIAQLVSVWRYVLTHPSVQTFDDQKTQASSERTMTGVIIAAVISAIAAFIGAMVLASTLSSLRGAGALGGVNIPVAEVNPVMSLVAGFVTPLIGFYLFSYALQFVASQWFGGRGILEQQSYLLSIIFAPVTILGALFNIVPCIGPFLALALFVYSLLLITYAVRAGQDIATGPAVISWIIAAVVTAVVLGILGWVSGGWL